MRDTSLAASNVSVSRLLEIETRRAPHETPFLGEPTIELCGAPEASGRLYGLHVFPLVVRDCHPEERKSPHGDRFAHVCHNLGLDDGVVVEAVYNP